MNNNNLDESFGTLSETINGLIKLGYTHDFNIKGDCIICHETNNVLSPDDFQIDKVYRFEGSSNPDDQSILYVISSINQDIKGTLVNGYGITSNEVISKLIEKLKIDNEPSTLENESNDATPKYPKNTHIAPPLLVEINLFELIEQIKNETTWAASDRSSVTVFKSETMKIMLMGLHESAELKPHKAGGVISVQVLEGKINFIAEQQKYLIGKGQMITLQENITHSVTALTESFFLLTLAIKSNK
ncbi:MAG: cupin domain-containing protein [Flavobacteriales bacterium]